MVKLVAMGKLLLLAAAIALTTLTLIPSGSVSAQNEGSCKDDCGCIGGNENCCSLPSGALCYSRSEGGL
jgi:hypothetical protein